MQQFSRLITDWNRVLHTTVQDAPQEDEQLGGGVLNWAINHLPFKMHLYDSDCKLGYNFCGPGTKWV